MPQGTFHLLTSFGRRPKTSTLFSGITATTFLSFTLLLGSAAPSAAQGDSEMQVNSYTVENLVWGSDASITPLSDGRFAVAWRSQTNGLADDDVWATFLDSSGAATATEFQVNDATPGTQMSPNVTELGDGSIVVAWRDVSAADIALRRFSSTGAPLASETLIGAATPGPGESEQCPAVAPTAAGGYLVTWLCTPNCLGGPLRTVVGQVLASDDSPIGTPFVLPTTMPGEGQQGCPEVASLGEDGFIVVWDQQFSGPQQRGRRLDSAGSPIGGELIFDDDGFTAQVTANGSNFVVGWTEFSGDQGSIHARRYDSSGMPLAPQISITPPEASQSWVLNDLSLSSTDEIFLTFQRIFTFGPFALDIDIGFAQLDNLDNVTTLLPQVNTYRPDQQQFPKVGADGSNFVVVWQSPGSLAAPDTPSLQARSSLGALFLDDFESGGVDLWAIQFP